jgi:hypothetical protein
MISHLEDGVSRCRYIGSRVMRFGSLLVSRGIPTGAPAIEAQHPLIMLTLDTRTDEQHSEE